MRRTEQKYVETIGAYDLFIVAITFLSLLNLLLYLIFSSETVLYVIGLIDVLLSFFFFIDFLRRLFKAPRKIEYFIKDFGWADLLASIPLPQFKLLRIIRMIKAYRLIKLAGGRKIVRDLLRNRASGAMYLILFLIILLLEFGSIAVLMAEKSSPEANIKTASDAIWWVYVTITTVGYGDKYPVTNQGRLVGMIVMLVGVGLFGVVTGFLANKFMPKTEDTQPQGESTSTITRLEGEISNMRQQIEELAIRRD